MREFSAHGNEWLVNAIKLSDFLQVDETGTKLRRTTEPQEAKNQLERSVYAVSPDAMFPPPLQSAQYLNRKASVMRIRRSNAVWKNSSNNMDQLVPCA
jgi:lupus La protein